MVRAGALLGLDLRIWRLGSSEEGTPYLRILVYLVIYDSG